MRPATLHAVRERVGNYQVLEEIGTGGTAVVYKCVQGSLGRLVAIKELRPSVARDSLFARRFDREARLLGELAHENLVQVYDLLDEPDSDAKYIVMEYLDGPSLSATLKKSGRFPVDVACAVALQLARALDYVHFRGLVHRDVKPGNVKVTGSGVVKLIDFGLARDEQPIHPDDTSSGIGTPNYMSPEQVLGDKVDFRSDIFSFGVLLFQLVTGERPFAEDKQRTVMQRIRLDDVPRARNVLPGLPAELDRILALCMQKAPSRRYASTELLVRDLEQLTAAVCRIHPRARIVHFLKDQGFVTHGPPERLSIPAVAAKPQGRWMRFEINRTHVAFLLAGLLLGVSAALLGHGLR